MTVTDMRSEDARSVGAPAGGSPAYFHTREAPEEPVELLDFALVLASRKGFILLFTFLAAIITAAISLVLPSVFTATTTMLPPQQSSSSSALLGQLGGLASLAGGGGGAASMLGLKNPADLYIGLLQSETITDGIVQRFHLMKVYHVKKLDDARGALKGSTKIVSEKSSLIRVSVSDRDPQRAAALANGYIVELHSLMSHLAVTDAAQRRLFFEQQLEKEKDKLADAEVALETTELKTGIIQPQGQAGAVIMTIAQLRAQISADEVELAALRTSATDENSNVVTLQSQIQGLRAQLKEFEKGHPGAAASVLTPTSQVPAASLEYIRRLRDVKYHETLFQLLARQYEMAKVDEAKQGQMIQVVDPALVPERRSWPQRSLLTLGALILGFCISSLWVILHASYQEKMENPETAAKVVRLRTALRLRGAKAG